MRIYYAILFILPILAVFSQSTSITASLPFTGSGYVAPLSQSGQTGYPLSPANAVYNYNTQNALYLISCPQQPQPSNSQSGQLFTTSGSQVFGGWMVSGNACQEGASGAYPVTITFTDELSRPSNQNLPSAKLSSPVLTMSGASYTTLTNLGYSPEVLTGGQAFLSSDFNSRSYIFDSVPIRGQQGIWTWSSIYADLSSPALETQLPITSSNTIQGVYVPPSGCSASSNPLSSDPSFADAYFGQVLAEDGYPITTNNLDFLEAVSLAELYQTPATGTAFRSWNPIGIDTYGTQYADGQSGPCGTYAVGTGNVQDVYATSSAGVNGLAHLFVTLPRYPFAGVGPPASPPIVEDFVSGTTSLAQFSSDLNSYLTNPPPGSDPSAILPGISQGVISQLQQWGVEYPNPASLHAYLLSQLGSYLPGGGNIGVTPNSCQYTYTLNSDATLDSIKNTQLPFPALQGQLIQLGLLPYLIYNANITNSAPSNEFNVGLSYDIYSPTNYQSPQGRIDPFTINSLGLFLANYSGAFAYVNTNGGVGVSLSSADSNLGLLYPQGGLSSAGSAGGVGNTPTMSCPDTYNPGQLTFQQIYACAYDAGFRGVQLAIMISISQAESGFNTDSGAIVGSNSNTDCVSSTYCYQASSCPTESQGSWNYNPACAFTWAYTQVEAYSSPSYGTCNPGAAPPPAITGIPNPHVFCYWGTYMFYNQDPPRDPNAAYCQYMPTTYSGENCPAGGNELQWPWASVGLANPGTGYGSISTSPSSSSTSSTYTISLKPISISATQNGYIFILGSNPSASSSSTTSSTSGACASNPVCAAAYSQLNVPYCYGGETARGGNPAPTSAGGNCDGAFGTGGLTSTSGGFDCSGLVQWAAKQAGFTIAAHYTVTQWKSETTHITPAQALPGDLVFFNVPGETSPGHVGICYNVGCTQMIDAPHTGAYVRIDPVSGFASIAGYARIPGNNGGGSVGASSSSSSPSPSSPNACMPAGTGQITEYQFLQYTLSCEGHGAQPNSKKYVYFLAIWAYYANQNANPSVQDSGDPILGTGVNDYYNPLYVCSSQGSGCTPASYSNAQDGITATAKALQNAGGITDALQNGYSSPSCSLNALLSNPTSNGCGTDNPSGNGQDPNAGATFQADFQNWGTCSSSNCQQFFSDLKSLYTSCQAGSCTLPSDVAGPISQWLNMQVPDGTSKAASSSGQPLTPAQKQYENEISSTGINLYVLKVIPKGYYNTSMYQPNTVPSAGDSVTFASNWNTYWNNVVGLQGQDVYVANVIPISNSYQLFSALYSGSGGLPVLDITPLNISSDAYGDVFITGYDNGGQGWIVEVSNTIGNGPLTFTARQLCPSNSGSGLSAATPPPSKMCSNKWPEIAVSPTGSQVYLANPESGFIPILNGGSLAYESSLSLSFTSDNTLYAGASVTPGQNIGVNIIDYFQNGGLYNITAYNCGHANQQPCSPADKAMAAIMKQYYSVVSGVAAQGSTPEQDVLDKVNWPNSGNANKDYHHPLGIQDVNGYLYVLDDWSGVAGEVCGYKVFGACPGSSGGILFNILDLRIINSTGVDVPIVPTYYNDLWQYADSNHYQLTKYTAASQQFYPPFGWIITANVSAQNNAQTGVFSCNPISGCGNGPQGLPSMLNLCGGGQFQGSGNNYLSCYGADQKYYQGSLLPIGPLVKAWGHCGGGFQPTILGGVGFSVNVNSTATIYIPSQNSKDVNTGCDGNQYGELIIANLNPQNYTKPIGGFNLIPFHQNANYNCYTGHGWPSGTTMTYRCNFDTNVNNIDAPVYTMPNPFEFNENIGGYQVLALDAIYSSAFSGGSGLGSGSIGSCTGSGCSLSTSSTNLLNGGAGSFGSASSNLNNLNSLGSGISTYATTLNSVISGYTVLPFEYTYSTTWSISNIGESSGSTAACMPPPPSLSSLETPQISTQTVYTYSTNAISSNPQQAQVESGATYAKSGLGSGSAYYEANLSSIIAPDILPYSVLTNRLFGKIYINSTISPTTNNQQIINATNQYTYNAITFSQGKHPGYEVVSAAATTQTITVTNGNIASLESQYGLSNLVAGEQLSIPGCTLPSCAAPLANTNNVYSVKNLFSSTLGAPILVLLFNWFKLPVDNINLELQLNGTQSSGSASAYGYHRLVYVYNDRFNNTIYMPLDIDISNITQIALNVTPDVNAINVNQTTININGTASWTPPFSANSIPLNGGFVYLYYDTNLNTIGFNAIGDPTDADTCAFSSNTPPGQGVSASECRLANPVWNGLQYNPNPSTGALSDLNKGLYLDGSPYISANIVTYSPDVNAQGNCPLPANSLLAPINTIYTLCNIYPSTHYPSYTGTGKKITLSPSCPDNAQGKTQYCEAIFTNGTGICTSQIGLIGIYPTNAMGYFSTNVLACGAGTATIIAQYYGTPSPEPIYASQSPLTSAADPSSTQHVSFLTANYAWSPVQTSQTVEIGSLLLSIGDIEYLPIFVVAAGAALILYGTLRKGNNKPKRSRK